MACSTIVKGINAACDASQGGIKEVYMTTADVEFTVSAVSGDEMVTVVSGITTGETPNVFHFQFRKNTASMTSTLNVDDANGVNYVSTELNMLFTRMDSNKRTAMAALAVGQAKAIVIDANGRAWLLGFDEPIQASAGEGATGAAKGDGNRYSITLTDESTSWPYEVTSTVLESIKEAAVD